MAGAAAYFFAQLKRILKLAPAQLAADLLVCACAGIFAYLLVAQETFAAGGVRYRIGMVGDLSDSYLGFGIAALQEMDDSRFMVELVGMSEEEAEEAFLRGELYAVMRVPEGLLESIVRGDNDCLIIYTAAEGQRGLGTMVMGEITDIASTLVTSSQSAIYAMQRMLVDQGRGDEVGPETDRLNLSLINLVLSRSGFSDVELLGYADGLSMELYYFCSAVLLFLLLAGLLNCAFFVRRSAALAPFMKARGVGTFRQVLGEYLAYLGLVVMGLFSLCVPLAVVLEREFLVIPEWEGMGASPFWRFFWTLFPVAVMFGALQFFLYEAAEGIVNGILLQFFCGIGLGYFGGYFYPSAFFPERMRMIGSVLPSGIAARYVEEGLFGGASMGAVSAVFAYLAVFLALTVMVRRGRTGRQ
ncbi:MAG: ABC transporter permease [Lachnospiraceae bacterium]|nr:ABC transporter permease [Lachnospiraceae bacterium]